MMLFKKMNNKNRLLKITLFFFVAITFNFSIILAENTLPQSWYLLPEEQTKGINMQFSSALEEDKKVEKAFAPIKKSQQINLDILDELPEAKSFNGEQKTSWHLSELHVELGVTHKGTVGILGMKGSRAVQLRFKKKEAPAQENMTAEEEKDEVVDLFIHGENDKNELEKKLKPVIQAAIATGKIKNTDRFKKELLGATKEASILVAAADKHPSPGWEIEKFRFEFTVGAEGTVFVGIKAGGELRLRFDFVPIMKKVSKPLTYVAASQQEQKRKNFNAFTKTLAKNLEQIAEKHVQDNEFKLTIFRFGFGLAGTVDFGLVKASAGYMGLVFFKKRKHSMGTLNNFSANKSYPILIISDANEQCLQAAKEHSVKSYNESSSIIVHEVDEKKLLQGLAKATSMAFKIADNSVKNKNGAWYLYKIRPIFRLSVTGDLAIATLGTQSTVEMTLER